VRFKKSRSEMKNYVVQRNAEKRSSKMTARPAVEGRNGISIAPPNYGIGFVDQPLNSFANAASQRTAVFKQDYEESYQSSLRAKVALFVEGLQMKAASALAQSRIEEPLLTNSTGLPDDLRYGVEALSGISLDAVNVHYNSSRPALLNALAYTQGRDIHVAPGQERHLPHEAWHAVQQAQGRVRPTMQMKGGAPVNDDKGLEHEADVMGATAMGSAMKRGRPQEDTLFQRMPSGSADPSYRPAWQTAPQAVSAQTVRPIQRMAVSAITDFKQAGGTCGLYSLGMAMSGVQPSLIGKRDALLKRLLAAGNDVGTFVGEFMDANNLAVVARMLGFTANIINFTDANDMENKLTGTAGDGVVMGYSVFDVPTYGINEPTLTAFKYLFSHFSVVEALDRTHVPHHLTVRDPNNPGIPRQTAAPTFWQSNQDAHNPAGQFDFQEFENRLVPTGQPDVVTLRGIWENAELGSRGFAHETSKTPLDPRHLPSVPLSLAGKIVSVSGQLMAAPHVSESCKLRDAHKVEIEALKEGDNIRILDKNKAGKTFDLGSWWSRSKEHYWVSTEAGNEGWVRKDAIVE
jgi:Domain of unknown function (DUF4157)